MKDRTQLNIEEWHAVAQVMERVRNYAIYSEQIVGVSFDNDGEVAVVSFPAMRLRKVPTVDCGLAWVLEHK